MSSRHGARGPLGWLLGALFSLVVLSFATPSHAYPWMIRHGFAKCASCHTDPMGGETLTGFGRVISDTKLSTEWGDKDPSTKAELLFGIPEPHDFDLGGSIRYMTALYEFPKGGASGQLRSFPMQIDAYGQLRLFDHLRIAGSVGIGDVEAGSQFTRAAQITQNNGDHDLNLLSRSHWLGYDITNHVLVRAGRINLPFGMRIPEHVMWVRTATHTDRESDQQDGVAVSYSGGPWRGELMGILGNYQLSPDKFRDRGYSAYGEYVINPDLALGVSSRVTHAAADRFESGSPSNTRQAHGLTARYVPVSPVAILAEADVLFSSVRSAGYVGMVQGDYEFAQGFHAIVTGELQDMGKADGTAAVAGSGKPETGGWLSLGWFFFTHFDARVDLVVRHEAPITVESQLHCYF